MKSFFNIPLFKRVRFWASPLKIGPRLKMSSQYLGTLSSSITFTDELELITPTVILFLPSSSVIVTEGNVRKDNR